MKAGFEYKGRVWIDGEEASELVLEMESRGETARQNMEGDLERGV
jgi:hypothetical protein